MTSLTDAIGALVEPLAAAAGLELWDVEHSPGAIRVLVDRSGGVDLEQLGALARSVSEALDAHPELQPERRYELEVSSPGVERPLRRPAQFRRFVGALIAVKTAEPIEGSRRFQGILEHADDSGVRLATGPDLPYPLIQKAHTVFVWGPTPKPGSPARVGPPPSMKDSAP